MISEIRIWPVNGHPTVKANGSVIFNGNLKVKFLVLIGQNGLFVTLPKRKGLNKDKEETWYPDVVIIDESLRKDLQTQVISSYNKLVSNNATEAVSSAQTEETIDIPF